MAITIDRIVSVTGTVITTGFKQAALIGNVLTENVLVQADDNRTKSFTTAKSVGSYFGTSSDEYLFASTYFKGYTNSTSKPQSILFSRYVSSATAAYMFSSQLAAVSVVAAIKALVSPTFVANINDNTQTLTLVQADFASCTGLTDIAAVIQTALDDELAGCTCSIIGTNQFMVVAPSAGASTSTIDYCTGNVADLLGLVAGDSPTLSQGTPGGNAAFNMGKIVNANANWIALTYVNRLTGDTIDDDYAVTVDLTGWISTTNNNYLGLWWEGGSEAANSSSTTNMRARLVDAGYGATVSGSTTYNVPIQVDYNGLSTVNPVTTNEYGNYSAFVAGMGASINYNVVNGKINFAGKAQSGLAVNVNNTDDYDNLIQQGYNVYGNFASRANTYQFNEQGQLGSDYLWIDNLYDAVWLADQEQNQLAILIGAVTRIPYNDTGKAMVRGVLSNVANSAIQNGVIETGNDFDDDQIQAIIELVGSDISPILTQSGFYIYFPTITPAQRVQRQPLQVYFIYTNGGAVNSIALGQVFVS